MEFQEFWKERQRMCNSTDCAKCPINQMREGTICAQTIAAYPDNAELIIEQWVKDHPKQTNRQKFVEVFGRTYESLEMLVNMKEKKPYLPDWWNAEYQPPKGEEG